MCKFCDDMKYQRIRIPVQTKMADDNICENVDCGKCDGCSDENNYFEICSFNNVLSIDYYNKV
jgi:hypothetical protein